MTHSVFSIVPTFIMPHLQKSVHHVLDQALQGKETSNYEIEFFTASEEIRYLLGMLVNESILDAV